MGIKTTKHGIIHYIADCHVCGWRACMSTDETPLPEHVRASAKKHVLSTGHKISVEGGTSVEYEVEAGQ
jgi:hypothetical protein